MNHNFQESAWSNFVLQLVTQTTLSMVEDMLLPTIAVFSLPLNTTLIDPGA